MSSLSTVLFYELAASLGEKTSLKPTVDIKSRNYIWYFLTATFALLYRIEETIEFLRYLVKGGYQGSSVFLGHRKYVMQSLKKMFQNIS